MGLDGRVALVTGAARGIGGAIAWHLAADGARVALADLGLSEVEAVAAYLGPDPVAVRMGVRSWSSMEGAADTVESAHLPCGAIPLAYDPPAPIGGVGQ